MVKFVVLIVGRFDYIAVRVEDVASDCRTIISLSY